VQLTKNTSPIFILSVGVAIGLVSAATLPRVQAALTGPTEHKGLSVDSLSELSADTLQATIGLEGYTMRMRAVHIMPGGQIAQHSHKDRPGIVTMVQGEWVEGQPTGEQTYTSSGYGSFPENEDTIHWVYNRTDKLTTALVCDIAKAD